MFPLAISCLTTPNLPWFMDLTFQVPMQYCPLQHQTLLSLPDTSKTEHPSALAQPLHSFWSYFSTLLQLAYWTPTDLGGSSFSVFFFFFFLPFHTVYGVLKARILEWFDFPFSSGPHFVSPWLAVLHIPRTCSEPWLSHCWSSWIPKSSVATGYWSTCTWGPGPRPCWSCAGAEGSQATLLPLATLDVLENACVLYYLKWLIM